jgi:hypothetical protein
MAQNGITPCHTSLFLYVEKVLTATGIVTPPIANITPKPSTQKKKKDVKIVAHYGCFS